MNSILIAIAVIAVIVGAWAFLSRRKKPDTMAPVPGTIYTTTSVEPLTEAALWGANYFPGHHELTTASSTGSMLPLLVGGEYVVLAQDFDSVKWGSVVAYRTIGGSSPAIGSRLIHRIVDGNAVTGWIPQGDTLGCAIEDWNPITRDNYIGTLVGIFRKST